MMMSYSLLNHRDALSAICNKGGSHNYPHTPSVDTAGTVAQRTDAAFTPGDQVVVTNYDLGMNPAKGGWGVDPGTHRLGGAPARWPTEAWGATPRGYQRPANSASQCTVAGSSSPPVPRTGRWPESIGDLHQTSPPSKANFL